LRQKLKILNKKIAYLENEITRNRQRGLRIENPPSATPVSRPPKPAVVAQVKPPIEAKIQPVIVSSPVPEPKVLSVENAPPPAPPIAPPIPKAVEPKKEEPVILVPPPIVPPAEMPKPVAVTKVQKSTVKMGADWVAMSPEEKELYVFSATGALVRHDVVLMESSYVYIQVLNETLEKNPSLKDEYLDDLLISSIYEREPHTRAAIDKIKIRR